MPTYISMLRGINVGGHNKVPMDQLRAMFEQLGFKQVRTYIQSGNVVFQGQKSVPSDLSTQIEKEIVAMVREKIGPVAAFKIAITVSRLPKTRSGKILRGTMKKIADHGSWAMPATIEDPKALDEIREALEARAH